MVNRLPRIVAMNREWAARWQSRLGSDCSVSNNVVSAARRRSHFLQVHGKKKGPAIAEPLRGTMEKADAVGYWTARKNFSGSDAETASGLAPLTSVQGPVRALADCSFPVNVIVAPVVVRVKPRVGAAGGVVQA